MTVLAVDIGGTKFAAAAIGAGGEIRARAEVALPGSRPTEETPAQVISRITGNVMRAGLTSHAGTD
ncbi:ROK family protein [Streptosporangium roseum]|uniref:N-acetylmannosamine kinase n=1 Tax=Streptosporangium roseum (strain ATCC 12428 / DSM 43021 / JCM 3005 / KCTC 9067 / NCIMB 10171 / NRRL 2505 / NI 9100) TaxID=479432 RepID=D2BC50_STRRD|nr:ROK family protein [Streptosporangium roseum]ACZ88073.1 N-acetylmannosamine kinase [Streptosporangium roseum DSM 43021]